MEVKNNQNVLLHLGFPILNDALKCGINVTRLHALLLCLEQRSVAAHRVSAQMASATHPGAVHNVPTRIFPAAIDLCGLEWPCALRVLAGSRNMCVCAEEIHIHFTETRALHLGPSAQRFLSA